MADCEEEQKIEKTFYEIRKKFDEIEAASIEGEACNLEIAGPVAGSFVAGVTSYCVAKLHGGFPKIQKIGLTVAIASLFVFPTSNRDEQLEEFKTIARFRDHIDGGIYYKDASRIYDVNRFLERSTYLNYPHRYVGFPMFEKSKKEFAERVETRLQKNDYIAKIWAKHQTSLFFRKFVN